MSYGNVLVVEDDDTIRRLVIQLLEARALHVDGARDGADALHQVATRRYSVIVLDVMMPFMSGIDFLDSLNVLLYDPALKSIENPPAVLVITSAPEDVIPTAEVKRRFSMVRAVLRKPLDVPAFVSTFDQLLGQGEVDGPSDRFA